MNKIFSRGFFTMNDIPVAPAVVVQREQNIISDPMPRPYVIKPPHMGSSVGVQVVFADSPFSFATFDWEFGDTMLVERYIPGREVQVGILDGQALCVGEILTKNSFHDYASKYEAGIAVHIVPAVLPQHVADKMMEVALKIHTLLNCRSVSRVDFRYDDTTPGKEEFFVLEINTHPGCTPFSLYPELAEAAGVSFEQMVDRVVKSARCDLLHKKDMKSKAIAKIAAI